DHAARAAVFVPSPSPSAASSQARAASGRANGRTSWSAASPGGTDSGATGSGADTPSATAAPRAPSAAARISINQRATGRTLFTVPKIERPIGRIKRNICPRPARPIHSRAPGRAGAATALLPRLQALRRLAEGVAPAAGRAHVGVAEPELVV